MSWYLNNEDKLLFSSRIIYEGGRYIKADYIEFDWEHNGGFIDTGIVDDGQDTWLVNFEFLEIGAENWICGTVLHETYGVAWLVGTDNGTSWYSGQGQWNYTSGIVLNQRISCSKSAWGSYPFVNKIYLGCRNWAPAGAYMPNNSNPSHFRVYQFDISRGGTALCTMRPAYDTINEEWGMYDETRNQFFGNAGGEGTSIAGGYFQEPTDQTPEVLAFDYDDPPIAMWRLADDIIINGLLPEPLVDDQGAFNKCLNLVYVEIPESVKSIGKYAFHETALTSVKIASDCTYYDTSFPTGCTINFYS